MVEKSRPYQGGGDSESGDDGRADPVGAGGGGGDDVEEHRGVEEPVVDMDDGAEELDEERPG